MLCNTNKVIRNNPAKEKAPEMGAGNEKVKMQRKFFR